MSIVSLVAKYGTSGFSMGGRYSRGVISSIARKHVVKLQPSCTAPYFKGPIMTYSPVQQCSSSSSKISSKLSSEDGLDDKDEEESVNEQPLSKEFAMWSKAVNKAVDGLAKKQTSLESEWRKAQGVEDTVARAQLIISNLYLFTARVTTVTAQDWDRNGEEVELTLDPKYESANAEAEALFAKARKLRRGSEVVKGLLEETSTAMHILQEASLSLESAQSEDGDINEGALRLVQDRLERSSKATRFSPPVADELKGTAKRKPHNNNQKVNDPASNLRKLVSPGGLPVLVGRNRRGNEYLSLVLAKGQDIWMHARGSPGAHVVLQVRKGGPQPTDVDLQYAADLAAFYSDARSETKTTITLANPKHVQKPKGAPLGAVKIREELSSLLGRPDDVEETLKLAREESGQADEYRIKDKVKHRKKTQEVAKQDRIKKRAETRTNRKERRAARSEGGNDLPDFY